MVILIRIIWFFQVKDRQKKKQTKGIRVDAEGDASLEDLTNPASAPQGTGYEGSPDAEKAKSNNKKVMNFIWNLLYLHIGLTPGKM